MRKPAWRTLIGLLSIAAMGGLACYFCKGSFADYAVLLKGLGWALAAKSSLEHGANIFTTPAETPK